MASRRIACLSRNLLRTKVPFHPTLRNPNSGRLFTSTPVSALPSENTNPQHDAQKDREKMNTDANETSKSGTDDTAAQNEEAAFNPNITNPQEAKKKAGEGNQVNPLDASPANPEISKGTVEE